MNVGDRRTRPAHRLRRCPGLMRGLPFLVGLLAAGNLLVGPYAWGQAAPPDSPRTSVQPVAALLLQYLSVEDRTRAETFLQAILEHPDARLEQVIQLLRETRTDDPAQTGMLPNQPIRVRGNTLSYGLFVPSSYDAAAVLPLVVCLHGAGFTGDSYLERWATRLGDAYILACPTSAMGTWWTRTSEELVLATIRDVRARYRVDPNRIYLTGMSNGGIGAWMIGMHHAPRFAGVAPMAGGIDDVLFPFLDNLRQAPVYVIHGARDQIMPVWLSRNITNELARRGIAFTYREHTLAHPHAGGHFFPRQELPALMEWFGRQRRDPYPRRLTVVRDASHLSDFGWVRIEATDRIAMFSERLVDRSDDLMKNNVYATLDATITHDNHIDVRTERVRRYTLLLNDALVDFSRPVTVTTNGHVNFESRVVPRVETLLRDVRRRQDVDRLFPARVTLDVAR